MTDVLIRKMSREEAARVVLEALGFLDTRTPAERLEESENISREAYEQQIEAGIDPEEAEINCKYGVGFVRSDVEVQVLRALHNWLKELKD